MSFNKVMFSSLSDEWRTPQSLFDKLDKEFDFDSDPCPSNKPLKKGLINSWGKRVFVNPPYSDIKYWVSKCWHESNNKIIVMLIPSRTDTKWWHEYVMKAKEIRGTDKNTLSEKTIELKKELVKMNAQIAIGTVIKNPGQVRKIKKTLAKIITIQKEKSEQKKKETKKTEVDKKV